MTLTDLNNNIINLLPIVLIEGVEPVSVALRAFPEREGELLKAETVAEVTVFGKISGIGDFQDLTQNPLDISENYPDFVEIEIKAELTPGITGVTRRSVFLGSSQDSPAAWLD